MAVWYVRVNKGARIRLRADFGISEFQAEYQDAVTGKIRPKNNDPATGTLGWFVARYRESSVWLALSFATRRQRENILRQVLSTAGAEPLGRIDRKAIIAGRERRASTPFQARHFLDTMRGFFQWALENEHIKADPTEGLKIRKPKTDGFEVWTEDEIEQFEQRWPRARASASCSTFSSIQVCAVVMPPSWESNTSEKV
jgi:integrase